MFINPYLTKKERVFNKAPPDSGQHLETVQGKSTDWYPSVVYIVRLEVLMKMRRWNLMIYLQDSGQYPGKQNKLWPWPVKSTYACSWVF